jgi:8-hydroxy-5-deazaflavin:NADPH oxidoreductase
MWHTRPAPDAARTYGDRYGNPPFRVWWRAHPQVGLGLFWQAAAYGELVVNATAGGASLEALRLADERHLDGKVLLDVANPLDFSRGTPPCLMVCNTDSLAEHIQHRFPGARVVKALNTVNTAVTADPAKVGAGDHTVFVSGNDADAKATVGDLLASMGWSDIIDLGDLTTARGCEMLLPLWLRLSQVLHTPMYNFKVLR